jgi:hypothetical protein
MAEIAKEANLTPDQANKVWDSYIKDNLTAVKNNTEAQTKAFGESDKALRGDWGSAYNDKTMMADNVIKQFAPKEAHEALTADLNGPNGAAWKKTLAEVGGKFSENSIGEFQAKRYSLTPSEANQKIIDITSNKDGPYHNEDINVRQPAIDEVNALWKIVGNAR